jgi:hypothetical protein
VWRLESELEALDLAAVCVENETDRLLLYAESLTEDFYRLRTGLAGEILQKFVNYNIQVAAVIPLEQVNQGRFQEMVLEANRGCQFHVFQTREKAEQWYQWHILFGLSGFALSVFESACPRQ